MSSGQDPYQASGNQERAVAEHIRKVLRKLIDHKGPKRQA